MTVTGVNVVKRDNNIINVLFSLNTVLSFGWTHAQVSAGRFTLTLWTATLTGTTGSVGTLSRQHLPRHLSRLCHFNVKLKFPLNAAGVCPQRGERASLNRLSFGSHSQTVPWRDDHYIHTFILLQVHPFIYVFMGSMLSFLKCKFSTH